MESNALRISDVVGDEILALSELLYDESTPNIYNRVGVNLQRKTYSSALTDDAPDP